MKYSCVMMEKTYDIIIEHLDKLEIDLVNGKILNRRVSQPNGYPQIFLRKRYVKVHQIIGVLLWGRDCIGMQINHIDGVKHNNRPENLELVTPSRNNKHAYELKLQKPKLGSMNGAAKLNEDQVVEIKELLSEGTSGTEIAKMYGVSKDTISMIKTGKTWKHVS